MFPDMRRKKQQMSHDETIQLLQACPYCILATVDKEGQPYTTPISYILLEGKIYVHGLKDGMKFTNIANNSKVCLSVVRNTEPFWDNGFTTTYESATVFGMASTVEDDERKILVLKTLVDKYLPEHMEKSDGNIQKMWKAVQVVEIEIVHMTGKANRK